MNAVRRTGTAPDREGTAGGGSGGGRTSTIVDVARRAGVSPMTVSRVINGSGYASAAARARVEQAVSELGYVPNGVARNLRSRKTRTIALVVSDITNPFFTTIARGVEDVASRRGYGVMFANTDENEAKEGEYLRLLVERQIDGLLLVPAGSSPRPFRLLDPAKTPTVVLDRRIAARSLDEVRCDSEDGAYRLVRHLTDLGHRRIAIITGRKEISTSADRVAGYERALREAGIPLSPELVAYDSFTVEAGRRQTRRLLSLEPRPTAVVATNNFLAFGALHAMRDAGVRIPDDMSLVAYDDLPAEWLVDRFFTVLAQPAYELGRQAAELLLDRLESARPSAREVLVLPGELIVRKSSGPPPGAAAIARSSG